jgi:hypothetical protein
MNSAMNECEWKAVLVLNSAAITMMKGSDFQQGAETLKDAMRVLGQAASGSPPDVSLIIEKLEKANRRIFNPTSASVQASTSSIQIIHHDGAIDGPTVDAAVFEASTCPNRLLVIRLESSEVGIKEVHAILVHNYAMCWSQGNTKITKQLLQASLDLLSQLYNNAVDPFLVQRVITLMKITADALAQVMDALLEGEEAGSLRTNLLEFLYREAQELASSEMYLSPSASPAA